MMGPELMRDKERRINFSAKVQLHRVSSSHDNDYNMSFMQTKLASRSSPTVPETQAKTSSKKKGSRRDRLRSSPREDDDIPIFVSKTPKQTSIIAEIVLTSDDEDSPKPQKIEETPANESKKEVKKDRIDLQNADLDAPKVYAVWSKAGPPGPPISDSEDETFPDKLNLSKLVKIEREDSEPEDKRKELRNRKYFDWDSSSSEDGDKKRERRGKGKRKSHDRDPIFRASKLRNERYSID